MLHVFGSRNRVKFSASPRFGGESHFRFERMHDVLGDEVGDPRQ